MEAETIQRDAPKASSMGGRTPLVRLAIQVVSAGISPLSIINSALIPGRETVGEQFATRQMFLPDMMACAEAMRATKAVLKVEFRKQGMEQPMAGVVVLGTTRGNIHEIPEQLVGTLPAANDFRHWKWSAWAVEP